MPLSVGELGLHVTQCGLGRGLPLYQVAHQRYRQTDRTENRPVAQGKPFYKWSPKNVMQTCTKLVGKLFPV